MLVALLSLAFAGYTALNPHTVTVTQQQMQTNTQSVYFVQTQAVTSVSTATNVKPGFLASMRRPNFRSRNDPLSPYRAGSLNSTPRSSFKRCDRARSIKSRLA